MRAGKDRSRTVAALGGSKPHSSHRAANVAGGVSTVDASASIKIACARAGCFGHAMLAIRPAKSQAVGWPIPQTNSGSPSHVCDM